MIPKFYFYTIIENISFESDNLSRIWRDTFCTQIKKCHLYARQNQTKSVPILNRVYANALFLHYIFLHRMKSYCLLLNLTYERKPLAIMK